MMLQLEMHKEAHNMLRRKHAEHRMAKKNDVLMSMVFRAFKELVQEEVRQRNVARKFVMQWRNRRTSSVLRTWSGNAMTQRKNKQILEKVLFSRRHKLLLGTFRTWHTSAKMVRL